MLKFFRQIRKDLILSEGSRKYLLYALGEILLVVAGILIAFQVNNWNENRKQTQLEVHLLNDIKSDIQDNVDNLNNAISYLQKTRENDLKVISLYEHKTPYSDSLLSYFADFWGVWDPDFTYAGFENMKNIGVNIISDASLRKDIINLFEVKMQVLDQSKTSYQLQLISTMASPMLKKYFYRNYNSKSSTWPLVPDHYVQMMQDPEFYHVCTQFAYTQTVSIESFQAFNKDTRYVIADIDKALVSLK